MSMKKVVVNSCEIYFSGEIYNLSSFSFDNEFLLLENLYKEFNFDFLQKLDGVFTFCIYDKDKDLYFCARDRFGTIPFFYTFIDSKFYFSTTVDELFKSFDKPLRINKFALAKYMQYMSTFGEDSFYNDVIKLEESSYIVIKENILRVKKRYFKINTYKAVNDENIALNRIEELLIASIEKRLKRAPAALLSGGIDSSLISSIYTKICGRKIDTYSIGFSEHKNYCELNFAKIVAKNINSNHHEVIIDKKEYIDNFYNSLNSFEEPLADSAAIFLDIALKNISLSGVDKILSGEGADELFLGYDSYAKLLKYYEFKSTLTNVQNSFLDEIIISLQNRTKESEYLRRVVRNETIYNSFGEVYNDVQKRNLFNKLPTFKIDTAKKDPLDWMSYIDLKLWVSNSVMSKLNRVSINSKIDICTPFLDNDILNYLFSIKNSIRFGDTNKYLLKKIALKYIPDEIISRKKKGFNSPYNEWLNEEFGSSILDTILSVNRETNYFKNEYIKEIYELARDNKFKQHLYSLFVFSLWYKKRYL